MNRRIHALLATFAVVAAGVPANANLIDGRPYVPLPECPNVRQYVGIANDYAKKQLTGRVLAGLIDRLTALGNAYHACARDYEVTYITDSDKASAAQHRIAAEAALVYADAAVHLIVIFESMPKAKWKPFETSFVEAAHEAVVDAKYVLDRSDDETDKKHAKVVVTAMSRAARRYYPKRYDEIVEIAPDDIRAH
jgi:hypothetical protein